MSPTPSEPNRRADTGADAHSDTTASTAANTALVERFWEALAKRDFDAVGAFMADDGEYIDVPLVGSPGAGAIGPAQTAARLRLGLDPLSNYVLRDGTIVAQGDTVITEHAEEWYWHTGEHHLVRFCSVMQIRDGKVARWWDYVDLSQLIAAAPQWWLDHIMAGFVDTAAA